MLVLLVGVLPNLDPMLSELSCVIQRVGSLPEALLSMAGRAPQLVAVQGEVIHRHEDTVRALRMAGSDTPILVISDDHETRLEALRQGAQEVLAPKDCPSTSLQILIEQAQARVSFLRDRDERWDAATTLTRSRLVDRLAAAVAHEVNNPLAIVSGNMDALVEQVDTLKRALSTQVQSAEKSEISLIIDDLREIGSDASQAGWRINKVVKLLQRFSRRAATNYEDVDLNDLLEATLDFRFGMLGASVKVNKSLGHLPGLQLDPSALGQVLYTIFDSLAGDRDGPYMEFDIKTSGEGSHVVLQIKVHSPAIDPSLSAEVLSPLVGTSRWRDNENLELVACRRILHQLGGRAELEIRPQEQQLMLRVVLTANNEWDETSTGEFDLRSMLDIPNVLFIDDEVGLLNSYRRTFRRDFHVNLAENAAEALAAIEAGARYDSIVCDLRMPGLDGVGFYRRVMQIYSDQASRIIFVAGEINSPEHRSLRASIPNPFLQKPVNSSDLRNEIFRISGKQPKEN